jgi:hypothetical protein
MTKVVIIRDGLQKLELSLENNPPDGIQVDDPELVRRASGCSAIPRGH